MCSFCLWKREPDPTCLQGLNTTLLCVWNCKPSCCAAYDPVQKDFKPSVQHNHDNCFNAWSQSELLHMLHRLSIAAHLFSFKTKIVCYNQLPKLFFVIYFEKHFIHLLFFVVNLCYQNFSDKTNCSKTKFKSRIIIDSGFKRFFSQE